jgi:glutathione peroxidase
MKLEPRRPQKVTARVLPTPDLRPWIALAGIGLALAWALGSLPAAAGEATKEDRGPTIDHRVVTIEGETIPLDRYRGRAMLIVNTASKCGYTPQYEGLQALHERYGDRGLVVLGFPSNDFGNQEPGADAEIADFCKRNYGVTFPMMAKIHARGDDKAPLYRTLTEHAPEPVRGEVRWNFTKFLVDPDGHVVARFEPATEPLSEEITGAIEEVLPEGTR